MEGRMGPGYRLLRIRYVFIGTQFVRLTARDTIQVAAGLGSLAMTTRATLFHKGSFFRDVVPGSSLLFILVYILVQGKRMV